MLIENLEQANSLAKQIKEVKEHITRWEYAESFQENGNRVSIFGKNRGGTWSYAYIEGIPFNVLKVCSLDFYNKQLVLLQNQLLELK